MTAKSDRLSSSKPQAGIRPMLIAMCVTRKLSYLQKVAIRQLYLLVLTERYYYPISRIKVEYIVTFGRQKKKADIAIFDKYRPTVPYIIVELKKPKLKDGKEQLRSIYSDNVLSLRLLHTQSFLPNVYILYFNNRINSLMNRFSGGSVQPLITQIITQTTIKSLLPLFKIEAQTKLNKNIN